MSKKLVLGLDIGITSVGWGIIDLEEDKVIDSGVRLFFERDAKENLKRRTKRSSRRLLRRRKQRIEDLKILLNANNIINDSFYPLDKPYEIRAKATRAKVSNEELATALLHIVKRRGSVLDVIEDDTEKAKEQGQLKDMLANNEKLLKQDKDTYVCDIQLSRLDERGHIRGVDNIFKVESYLKEADAILSHNFISEEFSNKVLEIVKRKREYYEGPGSEKSPTPYGRYILVKGEIKKIDLIEKMRGKCSIYQTEPRAPRMSFTAELFNFLNDLNNLKVKDNSITTDQKQDIIENFILVKGGITPNELLKYLNVAEQTVVEGFRIDKKENPILTEFKGFKLILKAVQNNNLSQDIIRDAKLIDDIMEILTRAKGYEERINEIVALNHRSVSKKAAEIFANIPGVVGYHALSFKAMREMNDELLHTNLNQMQIITNKKLHKNDNYKGLKNIPIEEEGITNPVVKRSYREAIKVINAIRTKYGELSDIVIEMAREKNSDEQRKNIQNMQKIGDELNKQAALIANEYNVPLNTKLRHKIRLYHEQDCKCLYCGKEIELYNMVNNPYAYDIDHIIPISISLDDSMNNKVVVHTNCNRLKDNMTPFMFFASGKNTGWNYDEFKIFSNYLNKTNKIKRRKLQNLSFEKDITKYSVLKDFIERNLVDTRYASREIMSKITAYYKANEIPTVVHSVKGQITDMFRKKAQIFKDRDDYRHHAVDALIVASIKKQNILSKYFDLHYDKKKDRVVHKISGEIIEVENESDFFDQNTIEFISHLRELTPKISHKVDRKPNRQFSDETIYSARLVNNEFMRLGRYKDIYGADGEKLAKDIREEKHDKILMSKVDPRTYELLVKIVLETPIPEGAKNKNPFSLYKDENGYIRKHSKKGNGPIIKSVQFYNERLGNHQDISHKYTLDEEKRKVVLLQISPYRTDFYKDGEKYKFVTIRYADLKPTKEGYEIDSLWYSDELLRNKISKNAEFLFSLHKNEVFEIEKVDKDVVTTEILRFVCTNNNDKNIIEARPIDRHFYVKNDGVENKLVKQYMITIGNKIGSLKKFHVDIMGKLHPLKENEKLNLHIKN